MIKKYIIVGFTIFFFLFACPGIATLSVAIAEGLTSEESLVPLYSKEEVQEALARIRDDLEMNIEPDTEDMALFNTIKDEIVERVAGMESAAEKIRMEQPGFDLQDFEEEISDSTDLIDKLNTSLLIEQIDIVLDLIEILGPGAQEPQGEILNTKLPTRMLDKKADPFEEREVKFLGADPTEADLEYIRSPEIQEKAASLDYDLDKIFAYVLNNIHCVFYVGSSRDPVKTLKAEAGSPWDINYLLVMLLRASDIYSRFAYGDVKLNSNRLMRWTGAETPEAAVAILENNGISTRVTYDKKGAVKSATFYHVWTIAFDNGKWKEMEASYKEHIDTEKTDGVNISKEDMETFVNAAFSSNESYDILSLNQKVVSDFLKEQVDIIKESFGDLPEDEILGKIFGGREIIPAVEKNNLLPYLPESIIDDKRPVGEFSEIPDEMLYKVKVVMPGGNEYNGFLSTLADKRLSLVYEGAYDSHQAYIESIGGINNLRYPNTEAIRLVPVLQINGETVATGSIVKLCRGQNMKVSFLRPGGIWENTYKSLTAGNRYNMFIATQKTSMDEVLRLAEALENEVIESGLSGTDQMTNNMKDEALRLQNLLYSALVSKFSNIVSNSLDIVAVGHLSLSYTCSEIRPVWKCYPVLWWCIWRFDRIAKAGGHIDVVLNIKCPTSTTGNRDDEVSWMRFVGAISTNMEHAMLKALYGIDAVSTGKIFAKANESGIAIHVLDSPETLEADLAAISAPAYIKNYIGNSVNAGYTVMTPQRAVFVGSWSGYGWMAYAPDGSAGYMICGGLYNSIINGGSLTEAIDDAIDDFLLLLLHTADVAKAFIAASAMMIVAGIIMYAALTVSVAALSLAVTIPVATFLWLVGLSLASAATTSFLLLIDFLTGASARLRRKKYAYAYA